MGIKLLISPKWLKTRTLNLAGMLPWNVPTEFLKNYFQKGAWPSSRDPVNCMALSARPNSHKMVEAIWPQICVSRSRSRTWYLRLNVWTIEQYTVQTAAMGQIPRSTERILVFNQGHLQGQKVIFQGQISEFAHFCPFLSLGDFYIVSHN